MLCKEIKDKIEIDERTGKYQKHPDGNSETQKYSKQN